jgi:hypothetical protein
MARTTSRRNRARSRRFSAVELAVGVSLVGSLLAVVVPTFARELHASRTVEPIDGLQRIGVAAVAFAKARPVGEAFPPSAALTPPIVPRGRCQPDPPGLWDQPTWRALGYAPEPAEAPHCFSFAFDSALSPNRSTFRAHAHGDLDGDGIVSTFELTGHAVEGDPLGPAMDPGMYIDSEIE